MQQQQPKTLLPSQDHRVLLKQQLKQQQQQLKPQQLKPQQRALSASPTPSPSSPRLQRHEFAAALMRTPARWTPDDGEHEVLLVEYGGGHKYAPGRLELFAGAQRAGEDMRTAVIRELWRYTDLHFLDMPRLDSALRSAVGAPPAHLEAAVYHMLVQREASEGMVDRLLLAADARSIETLDDPAAPLGGPGFRLVWCRVSALRVIQCSLRRNMLARNRRRYFGPLLEWYIEADCARGICTAHFAKKLNLGVYRIHPMMQEEENEADVVTGPRRHSVADFRSDLPASFRESATSYFRESAASKAAAAEAASSSPPSSPLSSPPPSPGSFPPFLALLASTTRAKAGPFCWGYWHLAVRQTLMGLSKHLHLDLVHIEPADAAEALRREAAMESTAAADKANKVQKRWKKRSPAQRHCATAAVRRLFDGVQCEAETCTGVLLPDAGLAAAAAGDAPSPAVAGAFLELADDMEDGEVREDAAAASASSAQKSTATHAVAQVAVDFAAAVALLGLREDATEAVVESASGLRWWSMGTLRHLLNLRRKFERLLMTGMTRGAAMANMSAARQFKGRSVDAYTFSPALAAYLDWAQRAVARHSPVWTRRAFAAVLPPPAPEATPLAASFAPAPEVTPPAASFAPAPPASSPQQHSVVAAHEDEDEDKGDDVEEDGDEEEDDPEVPPPAASPPQMHDERAFPALPSRSSHHRPSPPVVVAAAEEEEEEDDVRPPARARGPPAAPEGPVLCAIPASPTEAATLPIAVAVNAVPLSAPPAVTAATTTNNTFIDFEFDLHRFAEQLAQDHAAARLREREQAKAFVLSLRQPKDSSSPPSAFDPVIAPPGLRRRPATPPPPPSTWASLAALTLCIGEPQSLQDLVLLDPIEEDNKQQQFMLANMSR